MGLRKRGWMSAAAALSACIVLTGCLVVPVPMKTRVKGVGGSTASLDQTALKVGETTREEASRKLEEIRMPLNSEKILWARYTKSSLGIFWMVGGPGGATGNGFRTWDDTNVFVRFGEDQKVQQVQVVKDRALQSAFEAFLKSGEVSRSPVSQEVVLEAKHVHSGNQWADVELILGADSFTVKERWKAKHTYRVKRGDLGSISMKYKEGIRGEAAWFKDTFRFIDENGKWRKFDLVIYAKDLPVLLGYLDSVKGPTARTN